MKLLNSAGFEQQRELSELQQGSLFGAMSIEGIRYLIKNGKLWQLDADDVLYETGSSANHFFIVCQGELQFIKVHEGLHLGTRFIHFGEEVGYVAMISLQPHGGRVIAQQDSLVLEIECNLYAELQSVHPQDFGILTLNLARDMARNIQRLNARLVEDCINS